MPLVCSGACYSNHALDWSRIADAERRRSWCSHRFFAVNPWSVWRRRSLFVRLLCCWWRRDSLRLSFLGMKSCRALDCSHCCRWGCLPSCGAGIAIARAITSDTAIIISVTIQENTHFEKAGLRQIDTGSCQHFRRSCWFAAGNWAESRRFFAGTCRSPVGGAGIGWGLLGLCFGYFDLQTKCPPLNHTTTAWDISALTRFGHSQAVLYASSHYGSWLAWCLRSYRRDWRCYRRLMSDYSDLRCSVGLTRWFASPPGAPNVRWY